jgi:HD superfamily phosphodiesterase
MKEQLIQKMKDVFGQDTKRIDHALAVLKYAEQIHVVEGGDPAVIIAAAILHDIGIHQAERIYGSAAGKYQELEGPPVAKPILEDSGFPTEKIDHICKIIANHHSAKNIDTIEFRVIWDADWLVNFPEEFANTSEEKRRQMVNRIFKTLRGRQIAEKLFI